MEPWQVSHIQRNKNDLIRFTVCDSSFLAILREHFVFDEFDVSKLEAVNNRKGSYAESELLYNILITREGAYNALIDACTRTTKTGSLDILKQARPDGTILCFREQHIKDSSNWNELSEKLKNEMRNKLVNFQGKHIKLSQLCDNHLEHLIDGKIMVELVKGNLPLIINNQVPDQVEYYIHRTIRSRNRLKSNVFQETCNDVFVVEGVEKHELTYLVGEEDTDVSGNQTECLTVRFILLEYEGDFEKICKLANTPVHWIRYKDNVCKLVKSSGSLKSLQKYVDKEQECSLEGKLVSMSSENKITVISDSPGMGKTILLANVSHQISSENPSILIRFIVMKELVQALHKKLMNLDSIVSYIAEQSSEFKCGRRLVASILKTSASILIFDGFDEVLLHQFPTAKQILQEICNLKSAQIFVATRPHMREELENTLNVLGYSMNPFEQPDKMNFLLKFWEMKGAKVDENLRQFSESCVTAISSKMSDFERDIAGIPLQCRLLAETYTEQAIKCSKLGIPSDLQSQPIGAIHSIFEMYERHMKMRFEKVCTESFLTRFAFRVVNKKSKIEAIKNVHVYYALELLFRDHTHLFPSLNTPPISMNELCALGFLEVTQSTEIRFVHRTFAEFFVAWFAVEMEMSGENTLSFLFNELLATKPTSEFVTTPFGELKLNGFSFNYPVITYFINGFTKLKFSRNLENVSQRVSMLMDSVHFSQVFRIFNASAINNYQFVPLAVSMCFKTCSSKTNNTNTAESNIYELLLITAKYSDVDLMKLFCSQRDLTKVKISFNSGLLVVTPLHVAVERGHYYLAQYLVRKYGNELTNLSYLLHFCVFESLRNKTCIVEDKIQIIKLLCRKNMVWLDEQLPDKITPLLQTNVNLELVKCLIEHGADVNVYDNNQNTILHKITENPVTPEFFRWIVFALSKRKFTLFNHPNLKQLTPLHCAVRQVELFKETLKLFKENSANFNAVDENKESPLFYAIRSERSLELIKTLIVLEANYKHENKNLENVLHICAKHAHSQAMEYFINSHNLNVKLKDIYGNSPLHLAVLRRSEEYELMQRLLINAGADVQNDDDDEQTLLKISSKLGTGLSLSVIKLMEEHGLDINPDVASDTLKLLISNINIMLREIDNEFVKVLEFLIEKGGEIRPIGLHYVYQRQPKSVWESEEVNKNIPAFVKSTDFTRLWSHSKTPRLLVSELIQNLAEDPVSKCQRFVEGVQTIKGSFERLCILLIKSNQLNSFLLLRQALYSSLKPYYQCNMFVTPPPFVIQFIHSQKRKSNNVVTLAILTKNPYFTIWRLGETINEHVVNIQESDIESHLQEHVHDDVIVLKVRVVTTHLINIVERSEVQGKTLFVCNQVSDDIENSNVITDSPTWDDISTRYLYKNAMFYIFHPKGNRVHELFASPQILSIISQKPFIETFPIKSYDIVRFKVGHDETLTQELKYLCQTVFHYVLEDKLVFQGITKDELKKYARFGQRIGRLGEDDGENLDYIILGNSQQSQQFEEICQQTFSNVHLIQHNQGSFKLVRTWGYEETIQWFFQNHICQQFPTCNCESKNLVVRLTLKAAYRFTTHRFECSLPLHDLAPFTLKMLELEHAEELFSLKALLIRLQESSVQNEDLHLQNKSHSEQIVHLVNSKLGGILVEQELYQVAMNTLFPNLGKNNQIWGLDKYVQAGMLKQMDNNLIVFVYPSLAWYFIAKLLIERGKSEKFIGITRVLTTNLLQDCFQFHKGKMLGKHCVPYAEFEIGLNSYRLLKTCEFVNILLFTFVNSLLKLDNVNGKRFKDDLKSCISTKSLLLEWMHACVNANLYHLLQLIMSFNVQLKISELKELLVLAMNHGDIPTIRVIVDHCFNKTSIPLADIEVYLGHAKINNISILHLGALRGNYEVMEYLLNDVKFGFKGKLQKSDKSMRNMLHFCVVDTITKSDYQVNERKRIVDLLLEHDNTLLKKNKGRATPLLVPNIHVDLITHLINLGVDVHATDNCGNNILHRCPEYLTPQEYHDAVQAVYDKEGVNMVRLFKECEKKGGTAFHRAVEHLEVLDSTIQLFSSVGVNFNALNRMKDSVFVYAVKHYRSARLLDTLNKFGANIHQRDYLYRSVSEYCRNNLTAQRYLSSRGDSMPPAGDTDTSVKAQNRIEFEL